MTSPRLQFSPMDVLRAEQARLASMRKQAVIDKNEDLINNIDSALGDIVNAMERHADILNAQMDMELGRVFTSGIN